MTFIISASQLSFGMQGDDVARLQEALQALGRSIPANETSPPVMGATTVAVLKAVQQDLGVPVTGVVDPSTVVVINKKLSSQAQEQRTIRGTVKNGIGQPAAGLIVSAFFQTPAGEVPASSSRTADDGSYVILYRGPPAASRIDLRLQVSRVDSDTTLPLPPIVLETSPSSSSILSDAQLLEIVHFELSTKAAPLKTEYEQVVNDLKPFIGDRTFAELVEDEDHHDVSLLALQSGWTLDKVAAIVTSHKLASEANAPAEMFYGMVRNGLPADAVALHATDPTVRRQALQDAVNAGTVPKNVGATDLEGFLERFKPSAPADLKSLLGTTLSEVEIERLVGLYFDSHSNPKAFWERVEGDNSLGNHAPKLKLTAQLATLTGNHQPLVNALQLQHGVERAVDLVRLTHDDWAVLVQSQGIGVPPGTDGSSHEEQTQNYVKEILHQVEAAFPTQFFAERLGPSPVADFLKSHNYDLRTTYPDRFFEQNSEAAATLNAEQRRQLSDFQRIFHLTNNSNETIALASAGVRSAQQIARMDLTAFSEKFRDTLTDDRAGQVHFQARRKTALALALYGEHGSALNRTELTALPKPRVRGEASAVSSIPDWESLFGSFDACACGPCISAHSPAAYLVDILDFLGARGVQQALLDRRPDLGEVELSCRNSTTLVPYIDLVNEILEQTVAPPLSFVATTIDSAFEPELNQPFVSQALAAVFQPPLQSDARIEVLDEGSRWRIWDESFAYNLVKQGDVLQIAARSRQTDGSSEDRRATPQYRNHAAYVELNQAVYPWGLPFDSNFESARTYLKHLGMSRAQLIEALRPIPKPFDPNAPVVYRLAAERLGISDSERRILTGEVLSPPRAPTDFWGLETFNETISVRELLDRSRLSFAELKALLSTSFLNPDLSLSIEVVPNEPVDTCKTDKLRIRGLNLEVLNRLHLFVRLQRRLGLTIEQTDRIVTALWHDPQSVSFSNEFLVRLDHIRSLATQLNLSMFETLVLWTPIDTREPNSLYSRLFFNPAISHPQHEDFKLLTDGTELVGTNQLLTKHSPVLQATLRLNSTELDLLVARTNGMLNLANLSFLYRHATLAKQLKLSIAELLIGIDLTSLDPFQVSQSHNSVRFVQTMKSIRDSGFTIAQLDYLLRHRASNASPLVPTELFLTETLTQLQNDLLKLMGETDEQAKQDSAIVDRVSSTLELRSDATKRLLSSVSHSGASAMEQFRALVVLNDTHGLPPVDRDHARASFETLEKLTKIATVLRTLDYPVSQLGWMLGSLPWLAEASAVIQANSIPFDDWYSLILLQQMRRELRLEAAALEAILSVMNAARIAQGTISQQRVKAEFFATLSTWLHWQPSLLESLLGNPDSLSDRGLLEAEVPKDYARPELMLRLHQAVAAVEQLGIPATLASQWCEDRLTAEDFRAIRNTVKAKYDLEAWRKVAVTFQDSLRNRQREALVDYLVVRPHLWSANAESGDVRDLYARLLIDVEMSACQLTSRLVQATGSVQLFAQRCLMGLEPGVQTVDPKWQQWRWMKNYRVWEANRKIWLYPENWIEPNLRDGKSPFFQELESELLQSDLDNASSEQALLRYLEKLDEVSRLEIVGCYEDDEDHVLHLFGRTIHSPRIYYYRRREGTNESWTSWTKLDLDIEGDHLVPVTWNRRLMLIWPMFTEKQVEESVTMPPPGEKLARGTRYWDVQLAWSEYQFGRWSGKYLSEPVELATGPRASDILFGKRTSGGSRDRARPKDSTPPDIEDEGTEPADPRPPVVPPSQHVTPPRLLQPNMMAFKTIISRDVLIVRGYLRLDYAGSNPQVNAGIAFPFGEFRFSGCRKTVATSPGSQMTTRNFSLAPKGTRFNGMWIEGSGSGLKMLDGTFPNWSASTLPSIEFERPNEPQPLPTDASRALTRRIDIPVLDGSLSAFRLVVPHQELQFTSNRPCFYLDAQRSFMITSTGSSDSRKNPRDWLVGDLATIGIPTRSRFGTGGVDHDSTESARTFTLLVPGRNGVRVERSFHRLNLKPTPRTGITFPTFWSTREYVFRNAHHPYVCEFVKRLNRQGVEGLLSLETQSLRNEHSFDVYKPTSRVHGEYPIDEVDFKPGGAYDLYNWELFFHIPLLIAEQLRINQRFEEAQRWFHYIFDPTGATGGDTPQRFWRMKPFHDRLSRDYEQQTADFLEKLGADGVPDDLQVAVDVWRENPFNPHAVARLRTTAYQKTVVMKYIENLIAWGDQLFQQDTLESVNEATQLYVLAAEVLGRRPESIERKRVARIETFNTLQSRLGALSNALERIELLVTSNHSQVARPISADAPDLPMNGILYFCVPENSQLSVLWDKVADRLFKIRHCMNIEGTVRELSLLAPPIDPALLVRAQAAGLSIADVLSDINGPMPVYRFPVTLQKANELATEVRNLGAALLAALERKDSEALSTMRSGQELRLLQAVQDVRQQQIDEAAAQIASLISSRKMAQARKDYYESREFLSPGEAKSMKSLELSERSIEGKFSIQVLAAILSKLGVVKLGSPTTAGIEIGSTHVATGLNYAAAALETTASVLNIHSQMEGRLADYQRREDEWEHQANLATIELKQIDQQLAAANIRLAMAEQELRNHKQQIDNAREVDQFLRSKFTNTELQQWTIDQISSLYFQSYQLAYAQSKLAEKCLRFELGLQDSNYVRFGYWDSLKKGLLAAEKLQLDLRRLEVAHLEQNRREFELTKHVSLALLDPLALIKLRETGRCLISLPEEIFDLDYPGHYFRRVKSVSITLPCVVGPYTTISCTLRMLKNSIRISTTNGDQGYPRNTDSDGMPMEDSRFVENHIPVNVMACSQAQNDSGVFELGFRDERYLPFEGSGVVSLWSLELFSEDPANNSSPADFGKTLRQFDYATITDAILHLKYTSREEGGAFKSAAIAHLRDAFSQRGSIGSMRMFSLRQEYPSQWQRFLKPADSNAGNSFVLELSRNLFRWLDHDKPLKIDWLYLLARCKDIGGYEVDLTLQPSPMTTESILLTRLEDYGGLHFGQKDCSRLEIVVPQTTDSTFKIKLNMKRPEGGNLLHADVEDLFLVARYRWDVD